jgi:hypothetical protein
MVATAGTNSDDDDCELLRLWAALPTSPPAVQTLASEHDIRAREERSAFRRPPHYLSEIAPFAVAAMSAGDSDDEEWTWNGRTPAQWADAFLMHHPDCADPQCVGCEVPGQPEVRINNAGELYFHFPQLQMSKPLRPRTRSPDVVCMGLQPAVRDARLQADAVMPASKKPRCAQGRDDGDSPVKMFLPAAQQSGGVMKHCIRHIEALTQKPRNFKIGVAHSPLRRWDNKQYGYALDKRFCAMDVVAELNTSEAAAFLEASLIAKFQQKIGNVNRAPGGEGIKGTAASQPCYVYVVHGPVWSANDDAL